MKSNVKSFYIILTIKIMLMNVLLKMRMFGLFSETSQEVTNNEMQAYIIHSGFISGYQNRYGDNLKPPTNVYHRMTA